MSEEHGSAWAGRLSRVDRSSAVFRREQPKFLRGRLFWAYTEVWKAATRCEQTSDQRWIAPKGSAWSQGSFARASGKIISKPAWACLLIAVFCVCACVEQPQGKHLFALLLQKNTSLSQCSHVLWGALAGLAESFALSLLSYVSLCFSASPFAVHYL